MVGETTHLSTYPDETVATSAFPSIPKQQLRADAAQFSGSESATFAVPNYSYHACYNELSEGELSFDTSVYEQICFGPPSF